MPRRSEDYAEGKKKKKKKRWKLLLRRKQERATRDETRQASATRRRDSPSLQVSNSKSPNRGPHLGDPKTIGTSYFSFYHFLKKNVYLKFSSIC
jgi:hypothetical protein